MGQAQAKPLTPEESRRLREYSVYIAVLMAASSRSRARSHPSAVRELTAPQIVTMLQDSRRVVPPPALPSVRPQPTSSAVTAPKGQQLAKGFSAPRKLAVDLEQALIDGRSEQEVAAAIKIQSMLRGRHVRRRAFLQRQGTNREELRKSHGDRSALVEHPGRHSHRALPKSLEA
jgi:hypothetical protein